MEEEANLTIHVNSSLLSEVEGYPLPAPQGTDGLEDLPVEDGGTFSLLDQDPGAIELPAGSVSGSSLMSPSAQDLADLLLQESGDVDLDALGLESNPSEDDHMLAEMSAGSEDVPDPGDIRMLNSLLDDQSQHDLI